MRRGSTWIDTSSNASALAEPIRALAAERGVDVLDAPVGGGVAAAQDATLAFYVGGSAEVLDRHRGVFDALGDPRRLVHVGGPGTGYTTKLLVNLLWFGQAVATAEALLLGKRAGIDLGVLRGALADSAAASRFVSSDLDALFAGDYLTSFELDRCCEELANVTAQAHELGVPFELSDLVERIHLRGAVALRAGRGRAALRRSPRGTGGDPPARRRRCDRTHGLTGAWLG